MVRRPLSEYREVARTSAWKAHGQKYAGWFVGWAYFRILALPVLVAALLFYLGAKVWRFVRPGGPGISAPEVPAFGGVLPWLVLGISATGASALLLAYWWSLDRRNRRGLLVGGLALIGLCVAIAAWMRG